jgi:hypothetical protein
MSAPNAYDYQNLYFDLGINLSRLGVVMLNVDPLWGITDAVAAAGCTLYRSPDEEQFWIDGAVGERTAHLTLLYGILERGKHLSQQVLHGWEADPIELEEIEVFPFEGYSCIVARAKMTPNLLEAHSRLSLLPHIDLFPDYKPHVTLAYVQGSNEQIADLAERLSHLKRCTLAPRGLNFGAE